MSHIYNIKLVNYIPPRMGFVPSYHQSYSSIVFLLNVTSCPASFKYLLEQCFPNFFLPYPKLLIEKSLFKCPCCGWIQFVWHYPKKKNTLTQFGVFYPGFGSAAVKTCLFSDFIIQLLTYKVNLISLLQFLFLFFFKCNFIYRLPYSGK